MGHGYHPDEHPSYCMMCDHPNYNGYDVCDACSDAFDEEDYDDDPDSWGGMTWEERTEFAALNIQNGNLTDAINFIMHDGDIRADSVVLALKVADWMCVNQVRTITTVTNQLIRLIESWERT